MGGTHLGAGCGSARRPRPTLPRFAARRRAGLLHQPAASRGIRQLVRTGPDLRHQETARHCGRPAPRRSWHGPSPDTFPRITCSNTPAWNAATNAYPPVPGTPSSTTSATPPIPPGSPVAPGTGCDTAMPSRCIGTPSSGGFFRRLAAGRPARGRRRLGRGRADPARRGRAGDGYAAVRLVGLLAGRGDLDGAAQILQARANTGDRPPPGGWPTCSRSAATCTGPRRPARGRRRRRVRCLRLAGLLAERGDLEGLRARADAGDGPAALQLADLLEKRGDLDGAETCATGGQRRRRGGRPAASRPAREARRPGRRHTDPARPGQRRRRGRCPAASRPAREARRPGRELRAGPTPATTTLPGGWPNCCKARRPGRRHTVCAPGRRWRLHAARQLAGLLDKRGDLNGAAGPGRRRRPRRRPAAGRAAGQVRRPGRAAGTGQRRRPRRCLAASRLLAKHGDLDGLRARADAGDHAAARRLADLLEKRGDLDGAAQILRARVADAGDDGRARQLADLLAVPATYGLRAGPTPATGTPPGGWPNCSRSAATWTAPHRSCAPGWSTPATGRRPELVWRLSAGPG